MDKELINGMGIVANVGACFIYFGKSSLSLPYFFLHHVLILYSLLIDVF